MKEERPGIAPRPLGGCRCPRRGRYCPQVWKVEVSCTGGAIWPSRFLYSLTMPVCVSVTRRVKSTLVVAA